jgi:hypothetical protein
MNSGRLLIQAIAYTFVFTAIALIAGIFVPIHGVSAQSNGQTNTAASNKKFDIKDTERAIRYMQGNEKTNLVPIRPLALPAPSITTTKALTPALGANPNYIQPILFLASDVPESPGNTAAITATFQMLKRWYSGALEYNNSGYVFNPTNTIVYHAGQPLSYYKCPNHEASCDNSDGIWGNVQSELMAAGYPLWSSGTDFVVFVKGAGGWAGSNCISNCGANSPAPGPASSAGVAILGDWALDAITGTVNSDCFAVMGTACYQDPQRGAIGHELGHTFGLAHALDQDGSIMYSWWNFPFVSLFGVQGNDEKGTLRNSSIFFLPQTCSRDVLVNQVSMPTTVRAKSQFTASFAVINYGYCHWAAASTDIHIVRDDVWRTRGQQLGNDVYPAQPYTFSLTLTAPAIRRPTVYNSIWQLRASSRYFGPQMGNPIRVSL